MDDIKIVYQRAIPDVIDLPNSCSSCEILHCFHQGTFFTTWQYQQILSQQFGKFQIKVS